MFYKNISSKKPHFLKILGKLLYITVFSLIKALFSRCCFKFCCLIRNSKCIKNISKITCHYHGKIGKILVDAMISEAILREIIGTNFLTPITCSNKSESSSSLKLSLFLFFYGIDS